MVVLRFAPSPTGHLHVGNVRTALINWLFARQHQGRFLLRFDDTDTQRSQEKFKRTIQEDLEWLGWDWEETFCQSERLSLYDQAVARLKAQGRLYPCYETPEELAFKRKRLLAAGRPPVYDRAALALPSSQKATYEAEGRPPHWRFHLHEGSVEWQDLTRGPLSYESGALSDPILVRENGSYVYTLCSVVDDLEKGITHILRGNDHISNTAVQIQLTEALGGTADTFQFAHLPLLTGAQGESLSKRLGSLSLHELRHQGIEPMALNSYLAQLGSSQNLDPQKTLEALVQAFSLEAFSANAPKFCLSSLERLNSKLLKSLSYAEVLPILKAKGLAHIDEPFWNTVHNNITLLADLEALWTVLREDLSPTLDEESTKEDALEQRAFLALALETLPSGPWSEETWQQWTTLLKDKTGRKGKALFHPLRRVLTGQEQGPEMKKLLFLMQENRVRERLITHLALLDTFLEARPAL